jgi:hypothetical protein
MCQGGGPGVGARRHHLGYHETVGPARKPCGGPLGPRPIMGHKSPIGYLPGNRLLLGHPAMLSLDPTKLAEMSVPIGTGWLLGACMEARGKQDLWIRQKPEVLEALREQAIIHSVESSNRIEGITVAANRLRPLVIGRGRPRDRSEEELAGYRAALDWIFSRKNRVAIIPSVIRRLHAVHFGRHGGASAGSQSPTSKESSVGNEEGRPSSISGSWTRCTLGGYALSGCGLASLITQSGRRSSRLFEQERLNPEGARRVFSPTRLRALWRKLSG